MKTCLPIRARRNGAWTVASHTSACPIPYLQTRECSCTGPYRQERGSGKAGQLVEIGLYRPIQSLDVGRRLGEWREPGLHRWAVPKQVQMAETAFDQMAGQREHIAQGEELRGQGDLSYHMKARRDDWDAEPHGERTVQQCEEPGPEGPDPT